MGKPLIINKRVKISEKAQKKINKFKECGENSIEFKLLANIISSIERLEKEETNLLDINPIKGNKNKTLKETDKFPQSYFDILLNMVKRLVNAVLLIMFIYRIK